MLQKIIDYINIIIQIYLENPVGQFFGIIAFLITVYNFLLCKDRKFILVNMLASTFWGIHFFGIGLFPASLINFIDVGKNGLALRFEKNKIVASLLIIFYLIVLFFTYNGLISIIPSITAIISTLLVFFVRGIYLNIGFIFVICLWVIYNYIGHSIGGVISDIVLIFALIIGIFRSIFKPKQP